MAVIIRKSYTDGKTVLKYHQSKKDGESTLVFFIEDLDSDLNYGWRAIELNENDLEELILDLNKNLINIKNENKNG